jgi:hypothetical protein
MKAYKPLTEADVEFTIECEPEHIPVKGNCSAIDDETDAAQEKWVYDQLDSGNEWAWCCVKVTAQWKNYKGVDYLGCCSYLSEQDFIQGGYFEDMKAQALADLNASIARMRQELCGCEVI